MRIILVKINWWNPKAAGIGIVTLSDYCHAIVEIGLSTYIDASESRGNVDFTSYDKFKNSEILVYDIPYDTSKAARQAVIKKGSKYGWKGIWGWVIEACTLGLLKMNNARNMYCFEFALYVLSYVKEIKEESKPIFDKIFLDKIDSDDLLAALERANCPVVFEGKAKNYAKQVINNQ